MAGICIRDRIISSEAMKPPRRNQAARRAATRRALLDAAAQLFARRGYQATSLDEIAATAGLTRGALHYNFAGKSDLLLTLLEERMAVREGAVQGAAPADLAGALPFDRATSLLFLEFAAAAARDRTLGASLLDRLYGVREANIGAAESLLERAGADPRRAEDLVHIMGAFVNGLSIEALAGADIDVLNRRFAVLLELLVSGSAGCDRRVAMRGAVNIK